MASKQQNTIPADVARTANRAVYWRTTSILAIIGLVVVGWYAAHRISNVEHAEDPCSINLHGLTCQSRSCERAADVHYSLTPYCKGLLGRVKRGEINAGVGSNGPHQLSPHGVSAEHQATPAPGGRGGGGPGNGNGPTPGPGPSGGGTGGNQQPPAQAPGTQPNAVDGVNDIIDGVQNGVNSILHP